MAECAKCEKGEKSELVFPAAAKKEPKADKRKKANIFFYEFLFQGKFMSVFEESGFTAKYSDYFFPQRIFLYVCNLTSAKKKWTEDTSPSNDSSRLLFISKEREVLLRHGIVLPLIWSNGLLRSVFAKAEKREKRRKSE